ncbi:FHA domain-containing protein [Enterococcus sp. BWB1-3]|uniref:FHA domain-containing protein n=1 Tax=Enterococcus sp. BWB1-3 TaxID=2787713 RepID=UPI001923D66E|nr:FHA domain-containing protein [Enterococcus sp. BWB1-3]MBL1230518.1 FHA domain-containing protein [Enterococcus sp. BWB1-3]
MGGLIRCGNGHIFSSRRYGNICPYCNMHVKEETAQKNAAGADTTFDEDSEYIEELELIDPVVGWLVCIKGPQLGRDYRIMAEKNFIGRSDDMQIQILGDNRIARRNHAIVAYDPLKRSTLILPGDSQGLVYLNNEAVYTPVELNPYDVIQLGNSQFLFIPLCGEHFEWESLKSGE